MKKQDLGLNLLRGYFAQIVVSAACSPHFAETVRNTTELGYYGSDLAVNGWDLVCQWAFGIDRRLVRQI